MEMLSHVPLFGNIFRATIQESFGGVVPQESIDKIREMVIEMANAEIRWTKYASIGLLGFTEKSIEVFIQHRANEVMKNLGLEPIYDVDSKNNPLEKLLQKNIKGGELESRTNFFEANATEYSKSTVKTDY